jgi:hypothetical protein
LFKESRSVISPATCALADSGYQGLLGLYSNSQTPTKKTKLHPLTKEQKARIESFQKNAFSLKTLFTN